MPDASSAPDLAPLPPAPTGGYPGPDRKFFYDPNDTRRPLLDIAAPSEDDVKTFHLAPVEPYPEGAEIRDLDVTCIGTGMAGITCAQLFQWRLKNVNFKVFEKNPKPSGTWHENKYPGCRCDLAAHFYVWRWEPNDWSQDYVETDEIQEYFTRIAEKYNVSMFAHYSHELLSATWDNASQTWLLKIRTPSGEIVEDRTHVLVNGHGVLNRPKVAVFGGEEEFEKNGGIIMHTARFRRDVPLEGKVVAVIGNGSSGIQTIGTIGNKVKELLAHQRSNTWITNQLGTLDQLDAHVFTPQEREHYRSRKNAYDFFRRSWTMADMGYARFILGSPEQAASLAAAQKNLEKLIRDPKLRELLKPTYPVGCRRNTPHEHYFEMLQLPTTTIIKDPIERFTAKGIVAGGVERACDVVIKATGFDVSYLPAFPVLGKNGRSLADVWGEAGYPFSFRSVMSSGFPNFFHIMGPNAPVASNSIHMFEEQQIQYAVQVIRHLQTTGTASVDPFPEIEQAWFERMQDGLKSTIWNVDCGGWYKHASGKLTSHYPGPSTKYMDEIAHPIWDEFETVKLAALADPKTNAIKSTFGKSVEEVAKVGPPRPPTIPEGVESPELEREMARMSV
ncbi:hypothetical protein DFJ74DRAFT_99603 [Hyaloraphidium curvatum]|nr:hypothetical protein DFJ74DRAFT_99603 [Hyaloraphidium curvatum]